MDRSKHCSDGCAAGRLQSLADRLGVPTPARPAAASSSPGSADLDTLAPKGTHSQLHRVLQLLGPVLHAIEHSGSAASAPVAMIPSAASSERHGAPLATAPAGGSRPRSTSTASASGVSLSERRPSRAGAAPAPPVEVSGLTIDSVVPFHKHSARKATNAGRISAPVRSPASAAGSSLSGAASVAEGELRKRGGKQPPPPPAGARRGSAAAGGFRV